VPNPGWVSHRLAGLLTGAVIGTLLGGLGFRGADPLRLEPAILSRRVGTAGVFVAVTFPGGYIEPSSFRVRLNGADVTPLVTVAANGASGRLHGLLEGENLLELSAFARAPWRRDVLLQFERRVRVLYRPRLDADRG
jgi:hypothetical protein